MSYERPEKLKSITHKVKVACGNLYVTVSFDKNKPVEVFAQGSKSGGCRSSQEAMGRLTSALLQNGLIDEAIDQLKSITCIHCMKIKGGLPVKERKDFPMSCADAIGKILERIQAKAQNNGKKETDKENRK